MSKPSTEHNRQTQKSSNVDDSIKTAPDGRLIITDEPLDHPMKSGKNILFTRPSNSYINN